MPSVGPLRRVREASVAAQILLLQLLVVVVVVAGGLGLAYLDARRDRQQQASETALHVAHSVADSPYVPQQVGGRDPSRTLQPYAESVRRDTGTDFVVIMTPAGIRWTHPDPAQIGQHYLGSIAEAQRGEPHVEQYTGTLGPSVRAVVPVRDAGRIVALVSVGVTTASIERSLLPSLPPILLAAAGVLVVGSVGAWLVSRRLRRQTGGLGSAELTRMLEYYDAVLHSVREGLVLLDERGQVALANDEARRLLGLPLEAVGRSIEEVDLPRTLVERVTGGDVVHDEVHLVGDRILLVNRTPARWQGRVLGSVVTVRDHTDLQAVSGELDTVRGLAESLRSQNHEAANRLHTVVSLIEMGRGDEAVDFATRELEVAQRLTDRVVAAVDDPVLAATLLGKTAQAAERGIELTVDDRSRVRPHDFDPGDLVTMLGNLVDNAMDAVTEADRARRIAVAVCVEGSALEMVVSDSGPGVAEQQLALIFERGWSSKNEAGSMGRGIGLALVVQTVRRLGGTVAVNTSPMGGAEFTVRVPAVEPAVRL